MGKPDYIGSHERNIMNGRNFVYYSMRCRKHRQMAEAASSPRAAEVYKQIANAYAQRAALAMSIEY